MMSQNLEPKDRLSRESKEAGNSEFEKIAGLKQPSVLAEFVDFLIHNKKWWLTPIVFVLLIISVFVVLTSTAVGPFIYVLF